MTLYKNEVSVMGNFVDYFYPIDKAEHDFVVCSIVDK